MKNALLSVILLLLPLRSAADCAASTMRALARTKNYDEALAVADTVADTRRKAYARMCVMYAASRWTDLLADYADEPVAAWPDDIDHLVHHMRGMFKGTEGVQDA